MVVWPREQAFANRAEISPAWALAELAAMASAGDVSGARAAAAELPVTHVTRRQGRPYTLVLHKTNALFAREQETRAKDETDLEWLASQWNPGA